MSARRVRVFRQVYRERTLDEPRLAMVATQAWWDGEVLLLETFKQRRAQIDADWQFGSVEDELKHNSAVTVWRMARGASVTSRSRGVPTSSPSDALAAALRLAISIHDDTCDNYFAQGAA